MEKLGIYEYVAVIVPGVAFLFGLGVVLPDSHLFHTVLLPHDLGTATVHLFLAFALGHLLQVVGQLLHEHYWSDFQGLPTDWPFSREHQELSPDMQAVVLCAAGQHRAENLIDWRRAVATARSLVMTDGIAHRLETFQANYGMFRSIAVASILLLFVTPWGRLDVWKTCPVILAVTTVSVLGMHRFGVHYARELFAAIRARQEREHGPAYTSWPSPNEAAEPNLLRPTRRRQAA